MRVKFFAIICFFSIIGVISMLTGGISSLVAATIVPPAPPSPASPTVLQSIAVTPSSPTLAYGTPQQFTATGTYSDSSRKNITATVAWSSSKTSVATVSAAGLATAHAQGSASIIAASGTIHGQAAVTVPAPTLESIAVTPAAPTIKFGTPEQFAATGTYNDGSHKDLTKSAVWTSSKNAVATVSASGMATAHAEGSANIVATSGSVHGQAIVSVPAPTLESIAVTPSTPTLAYGTPRQFTATGAYNDGSHKNVTATVAWSSSNKSVATVSTAGVATSVAQGSANIIATSGTIHGQTAASVPAPTLQSIAVTPGSPTLAYGSPRQFTATGAFNDGSHKNLTSSVTWSSNKTSVATVSTSGVATAVAQGSADIIATSGSVHGQTAVSVPAPTLQSIAVTPASPTLAYGTPQQFTATGAYNDRSHQDLTATVIWSSDNTSVATVSASGVATAVAQGSADIIATSGSVNGQTTVSVPAAVRQYSGTASVGDFLSVSIDPNQGTLTYTDVSNGATGTVNYVVSQDGSSSLTDPAGHLLAVTEVPNYGIVALLNNAGATQDQLALVTSVVQENVTAATFENQSYNMLEFRTRGGGVGIGSLSIDGSGNISGTEYMPYNLLGSDNLGFNLFPPMALPAGPPQPYLTLNTGPSGNAKVFGTPTGMFLVDLPIGSIIGMPKAAKPDFDPNWANTYSLTYYQKTNAYGPDGNSPETGNLAWGIGSLVVDVSGDVTLNDGNGNQLFYGTLTAVANTPSLYDGTTTLGGGSPGELSDPCYGLFTFQLNTTDSQGNPVSQVVFVSFMEGAVLLSTFSTNSSWNPGDTYNYLYGVGLPQSAASIASNSGNSSGQGSNPPGAGSGNPPGVWNSLGGSVSPSAARSYVGSSATGDFLTFTVDPSTTPGTLDYYDVTNGIRGTATYTVNSDGTYAVTDPNNDVQAALELPGQSLFLEMTNTGFSAYQNVLPVLVTAVPEMNLTIGNFESQNYNFIQFQATDNLDEQIGSLAIDANGNLTGNGYMPNFELSTLLAQQPASYAFNNLVSLSFPSGTYPQPYVVTTQPNNPIQTPIYLFGYPNSLLLLGSQQGTLLGVPKGSAAFQPQVGGNPINGTYKLMFYRRQVNGRDQSGNESGPNGTKSWKGLDQTDGASMGFATLVISNTGLATLTDPNSGSPTWTGTLQAVSSEPYLYGTGSDGLLTDPCDGLYALHLQTNGGTQQQDVFIGFVPGTLPAVVLAGFSYPLPLANTANYNYRYGIGFMTGP